MNELKFIIHRIMDGSFPGSPDHDYVQISDDEMHIIWEMFKGRWRDTKEQAERDYGN